MDLKLNQEMLDVMKEFLCGCSSCAYGIGICPTTAFNYVAEIVHLRKKVEDLKESLNYVALAASTPRSTNN